MSSIRGKIFPAKQDLGNQYEDFQKRTDQGGLTPAKANLAMADVLCEEMTGALGATGPACFSVWLQGSVPNMTTLAGWSSPHHDGEARSELEEGNRVRHRVLGTRRPILLNDPDKTRELAAEIIAGPPPGDWETAALAPIEKAGESLGLALAFFTRPLAEADLEGMIRICDQLGSALLTDDQGLPLLP